MRGREKVVFVFMLFLATGGHAAMRLGDQKVEEKEDSMPMGIRHVGVAISYLALHPVETQQFEDGHGFLIEIPLEITNHLEMALGGGQYQQRVKDGDILFKGDLTATPILLSLKYHGMPRARLNPYLSLGAAYVLYDFEMAPLDPVLQADLDFYNATFHQTIKNGIGFTAGAGVRLFPFADRRFRLNADYRYLHVDADVESNLSIGPEWLFGRTGVMIGGHMLNLGAAFLF